MRVISQDGTDYPYEQIRIQIQNNQVTCKPCHYDGKAEVLGIYSSAEKARKAMEMLHGAYNSLEFLKNCFSEETFKVMRELLPEDEFDRITTSLFRFPSDDEIEVEE